MAEILTRSDLFSPCRHLTAPPPLRRANATNVSFAGFHHSPLRSLRSKSLFHGRKLAVVDVRRPSPNNGGAALSVQMSLRIGKAMKWWEKGLQSNMKEIASAQDLVDSLRDAGNKLVVVDFFSPGCGGCKALHPKICQFAEMNPDVMFLQINYEEHKSMCYSLNVHVLPFFRFYRGAHGRICSFSCTNATIKKFRDALAKHTTERCSLGPTKGLEESELLALAANKDLSFTYTRNPEPVQVPEAAPEPAHTSPKQPVRVAQEYLEKAFTAAARR